MARVFCLVFLLIGFNLDRTYSSNLCDVKTYIPFYLKSWVGPSFSANCMRDIEIEYDCGFATGLAVGTLISQSGFLQFEFQLEGLFLKHRISSIKFLGIKTGLHGNVHDWSCLSNLILSTRHLIINPYLGFGVGYGKETFEFECERMPKVKTHYRECVYQIIGGLSYSLINLYYFSSSFALEGRYLKFDNDIETGIVNISLIINY